MQSIDQIAIARIVRAGFLGCMVVGMAACSAPSNVYNEQRDIATAGCNGTVVKERQLGIELCAPQGWVVQTGVAGVAVLVEPSRDANLGFSGYLAVMIDQKLKGSAVNDLAEYVEFRRQGYARFQEHYQALEFNPDSRLNEQYSATTLLHKFQTGPQKMEGQLWFLVQFGRGISVEISASEVNYQTLRSRVAPILKSLRLTSPARPS